MKKTKRPIFVKKMKLTPATESDHEPSQSEISAGASKLRQAMLLEATTPSMITFIELEES